MRKLNEIEFEIEFEKEMKLRTQKETEFEIKFETELKLKRQKETEFETELKLKRQKKLDDENIMTGYAIIFLGGVFFFCVWVLQCCGVIVK